MIVVKIKNSHSCFECGRVVDYGVSKDGFNVFRVICSSCMKYYISAFNKFLDEGAKDKSKEGKSDEIPTSE